MCDDIRDQAKLDLYQAIAGVAAKADKAIRDYGAPSDIGMFVYEDMDQHRDMINSAMNFHRDELMHFPDEMLMQTLEEKHSGIGFKRAK